MRQILIIRYGGFGDMILSMGAFRTIRAHHAVDRIAALTISRFADLLRHSGYFDEVLLDERLKPWQIGGWLALARVLRGKHFDRIYDLQRNERTTILYRVISFGRHLEWSGVIPGCSHYVRDDPDDRRHIADRVAEQLAVAGIPETKPADLGWLTGDIGHFDLPPSYALLVPGGAPHRPEKRAPAEAFAGLGRHLMGQGIAPVSLPTAPMAWRASSAISPKLVRSERSIAPGQAPAIASIWSRSLSVPSKTGAIPCPIRWRPSPANASAGARFS